MFFASLLQKRVEKFSGDFLNAFTFLWVDTRALEECPIFGFELRVVWDILPNEISDDRSGGGGNGESELCNVDFCCCCSWSCWGLCFGDGKGGGGGGGDEEGKWEFIFLKSKLKDNYFLYFEGKLDP